KNPRRWFRYAQRFEIDRDVIAGGLATLVRQAGRNRAIHRDLHRAAGRGSGGIDDSQPAGRPRFAFEVTFVFERLEIIKGASRAAKIKMFFDLADGGRDSGVSLRLRDKLPNLLFPGI